MNYDHFWKVSWKTSSRNETWEAIKLYQLHWTSTTCLIDGKPNPSTSMADEVASVPNKQDTDWSGHSYCQDSESKPAFGKKIEVAMILASHDYIWRRDKRAWQFWQPILCTRRSISRLNHQQRRGISQPQFQKQKETSTIHGNLLNNKFWGFIATIPKAQCAVLHDATPHGARQAHGFHGKCHSHAALCQGIQEGILEWQGQVGIKKNIRNSTFKTSVWINQYKTWTFFAQIDWIPMNLPMLNTTSACWLCEP